MKSLEFLKQSCHDPFDWKGIGIVTVEAFGVYIFILGGYTPPYVMYKIDIENIVR